jgi:stringent starvation protein B
MNSPPIAPTAAGSSTRPYLIRALHDWCTDNGFTPFIAVFVDSQVQVPLEYVKDAEIVLNLGFEATTSLKIGNEVIEFKARFGGISREIVVPVDRVIAIYARENGQGMAFPSPPNGSAATAASVTQGPSGTLIRGPHLALSDPGPDRDAASPSGAAQARPVGPEPPGGGRPSLKRVK